MLTKRLFIQNSALTLIEEETIILKLKLEGGFKNPFKLKQKQKDKNET